MTLMYIISGILLGLIFTSLIQKDENKTNSDREEESENIKN